MRRPAVPSLALVPLLLLSACGGGSPRRDSTPPPPQRAEPAEAFDGLEGFLPLADAEAILARTERVAVSASADELTAGERAALEELMAVGEIFHDLYESSLHAEAGRVRRHLETYRPEGEAERRHVAALRDLYRLFDGPIVRTLDNERVALAPVAPYSPERSLYPPGADAEALAAYAASHPEAGLLEVRSVVRRRTAEALAADLATLDAHPEIETLHPDLGARLAAPPDRAGYYAIPYALAYVDEMLEAHRRLRRAATAVRADDEDLADFLEQRARDLLTNDYEAGDAVWVSGRPRRLNCQVGAYETYDDHLMGLRAFFSLSILLRDAEASAELERAVAHLPELAADLPGGPYEAVRARIPVGIYDVWADYGQARGANTASILPNESHIVRRYGRTILIRRNIIRNPAVLAVAGRRFRAAVAEEHAADLGESGGFDRTVFHEVGHYLGPARTADGRTIPEALGNLQNHLEELKADLISLWLMPRLVELDVIDAERMRSAYAAGVLRVLRPIPPLRDQPYQTMQLMQQRFFLDRGVLRFEDGALHVDYDRFPAAVEEMLAEVLEIQRRGDRAAAEAYVDRWAVWDDAVQGAIGRAVDEVAPRYYLVDYDALR